MIAPDYPGYLDESSNGERVERLQQLVGVPITGVYDEVTMQRVRGLQAIHGFPTDGLWDAALEMVVVEAQRQARGMSS